MSDFIPCAVCGKEKTQVFVDYICNDPKCREVMKAKHPMATAPMAPITKIRMFPKRQKYADTMTDAWKEIADVTGFNYDGTPKV